MIFAKKILATVLLLIGFALPAEAQLISSGQEKTVTYTPPTAIIAINTPALNFAQGTGFTTFILNVPTSVAIKLAITNETANGCLQTFSVAIAATPLPAVSSFNFSLQSWQIVPLIGANNSFVSNTFIDIPGNSTVYVTSTAINSTRVAIQVINTLGGCASTSIDVSATVIPVATSSPLISNTNGIFGSGTNVQGVVPNGSNGTPVLPIVDGALGPAINAGFNNTGIDNFSNVNTLIPSGQNGNFSLGFPPASTTSTNFTLALFGGVGGIGGNGLVSPWTCVTAACGAGSSGSINAAFLRNSTTNNALLYNLINSSNGEAMVVFETFPGTPNIRQQAFGNQTTSQATPGNTLSGSTLSLTITCSTFPCQIDSLSDTQGNKWILVKSVQINTGLSIGGLNTWVAGPSSAAAETVTFTVHAGTTVASSGIIELSSPTPASPNRPNTALSADNNSAVANETDPGGLFTQSGGFSVSQTVTLGAAGTFIFPLWQNVQNGAFQGCTVNLRVTAASGTTPTLNSFLQDSGDNLGFNDHLSLTQATAATSLEGIVPMVTATNLSALASSAVVTTDGSLAAGSAIAGPMGPFGRIKFVVGGTTPSFTINYNVLCK